MTTQPAAIPALEPFPHCAPLDGFHCITNALAKIYRFYKHPLSEEILFGLGAGLGFVYWRMRLGGEDSVFIGGRGNLKGFYQDLGQRTGVLIREMHTASAKKAESELLRSLQEQKPVMLGGDMGFLPWLEFPSGYHFGGHTFVACGFDGANTVLASDMVPKAAGLKKGFCAPITLEQLRKARSSPFKPFPPKNLWFEFDFSRARKPRPADVLSAIRQTVDMELWPPIRNLGVSGIRHAADQLLRWPHEFNDLALRLNLFNLYISFEIGGTGGGCFRKMYARFLNEAASIIGNRCLSDASTAFSQMGDEFSRIGQSFKTAEKMRNLDKAIAAASTTLRAIADQEEETWELIQKSL